MSRFNQIIVLACFAAAPVAAHNVSMSTSRLDVQGTTARMELRVPLYESQHVADPARTLPQSFEIDGKAPVSTKCAEESGAYMCRSEFQLGTTGSLRIRCTLSKAVVENHVHVMHATREGRLDQAVFDANLQEAVLTFRKAGPIENAFRARPQVIGVVLLVILAAGVLAGNARDALWVCGAFLLAAGIASMAGPLPWLLTPGFLETAVAVVAAYSAFEVIALESSGWRLMAGALLGIVFGRYALTLAGSPSPVALLAACVLGPAFGIALIYRWAPGARRKLAWIALLFALTWIVLALLG